MGLKVGVASGLLGCVLLVVGIAFIYPPAAVIAAGAILLIGSWLVLDAFGADR
jgi:hypothetical protein